MASRSAGWAATVARKDNYLSTIMVNRKLNRDWTQLALECPLVQASLWLAAGLNWSGFHDRDLRGSYYNTRKEADFGLRWKFDEDLFRSGKPAVNRTLERGD